MNRLYNHGEISMITCGTVRPNLISGEVKKMIIRKMIFGASECTNKKKGE